MPAGFVPGFPVPREQWVERGESCPGCGKRFTFFTSKSNCPNCGKLYCADCLQAECTIVPGDAPVQTCLPCFSMLQEHKRRELAVKEEQRRRNPQPTHQPPQATASSSSTTTPGVGSSNDSRPSANTIASAEVSQADFTEMKKQLEDLLAKARELRRENETLIVDLRLKDEVAANAMEALKTERESSGMQGQRCRELESSVAFEKAEGERRLREVEAQAREAAQQAAAQRVQLEDELAQIRNELSEKRQELLEAQQLLDQERDARRQSEKDVSDLKQKLCTMANQGLEQQRLQLNEEHRESIARLEEDVRRLQAEKEEAEQALTCAQSESRLDREEMERQKAQLERELTTRVELKESEIAALVAEKGQLQERLSHMEREASTDRVPSLEARVATLEQTNDALQAALTGARREAEEGAAELARQREAASARETAAMQELTAVKEKLASETAKAEAAQSALAANATTTEALQASVVELSAAKDRAMASTDASTEVKKLRAAAKHANEQLRTLREQVRAKDDELKRLQNEREALEVRSKESSKQLHQKMADLKSGHERSERALREANEKALSHRAALESERDTLLKRMETMQGIIGELKRERDAAVSCVCGGHTIATTLTPAAVLPPVRDGSSRWRQPTMVRPLTFAVPSLTDVQRAVHDPLPEEATLFNWGYNVAAAAEKVPSILQSVSTAAAVQLRLFECENGTTPSRDNLRRWQTMAAMVEANYSDNPYHSATHAADVLQGLCALLLSAPHITQHMTRVEKLGAVFAAMVHDIRHPGRTNGFLAKVFDPVYFQHGGHSVLERMHVSSALMLFSVPEADFTDGMSDAEVLELHRVVSTMVGGTDMAVHHASMQRWQDRACAGRYDFGKADDRVDVLSLLLHAADLGAQSKGVDVALRWRTVLEEMYQQGDDEAQRGLPVSLGCSRPANRDEAAEDVGQLTFMRAFVVPLFQIVQVVVPSLTAPLTNLRELHSFYQLRCGDTTPFPEAPLSHTSTASATTEETTDPKAQTRGGDGATSNTSASSAAAQTEQHAVALRAASEKVKAAATDVAARDNAVRRREDALKALEEKVLDGLRGLSTARSAGNVSLETSSAAGAESTRLSEGMSQTYRSAADAVGGTQDIAEKLLRATEKVVEKERQLRGRAAELERLAQNLEDRERMTAALSDQLAAIADRVNQQRRKVAREQARLSTAPTLETTDQSLARKMATATEERMNSVPTMKLSAEMDVVLQRLNKAVQHLSKAVSYAP